MTPALMGQIIVWLIIGGLAGAVAGFLVKGRKRGFGVIGNVIIGLIGALIGGFIFDFFNINIAGNIAFTANDLIASIVGALILLFLLFLVRR